MKKNIFIVFLALIAILFTSVISSLTNTTNEAKADVSTNNPLHGWAWSSNIGWISFNSMDNGANGGATYNTYVDPHGNFGGYAWSPHIGWIKFGGLSSFPSTDTGATQANAHVSTSTGDVTGFIRACTATQSGNCSNMTSRTDGWDGWISLSGNGHVTQGTGVTYDNIKHAFKGFAWGGDVVGWIDFSPDFPSSSGGGTTDTPIVCDGCDPGPGVPAPLTVTCTPNPTSPISLTEGESRDVTFSSSVTAGTAPYTYVWTNTGSTACSDENCTINYNTVGDYAPNVTVTDSEGAEGSVSCPITIKSVAVPPSSGEIDLRIDKTESGAHDGVTAGDTRPTWKKVLNVRQGLNFALAWKAEAPAGYDCRTLTEDVDGVSVNYWNSMWNSNVVNNNANSSVGGLGTVSVPIGKYSLTISCHDGSLPPNLISKSVTLYVKDTTWIEL